MDESEEEVEQVLPDGFILLFLHSTLNLDSQVADLVHKGFVRGVHRLQHLQDRLLDRFASLVGESPPQVFIVGLIIKVLGILLCRDVSAKDDSGELFCLDNDCRLLRVQTGS